MSQDIHSKEFEAIVRLVEVPSLSLLFSAFVSIHFLNLVIPNDNGVPSI
jgi:hypothetical protein